jgi:YbbR domain-containing protein
MVLCLYLYSTMKKMNRRWQEVVCFFLLILVLLGCNANNKAQKTTYNVTKKAFGNDSIVCIPLDTCYQHNKGIREPLIRENK